MLSNTSLIDCSKFQNLTAFQRIKNLNNAKFLNKVIVTNQKPFLFEGKIPQGDLNNAFSFW